LRHGTHSAIMLGMGTVSASRTYRDWSRAALLLLACAVIIAWGGDTRAGSDRVEQHRFHSRLFDDERTLLVRVPEAPDSSRTSPLPLLLSFQGEDLFDVDVAAGDTEWAVDALLDRNPAGIPPFLVVGLVSAPHAVREFATPGSRPDAQAQRLMQCLVEEVLPFVEARWPVTRKASERVLMGMGDSAWTAVYGAWVHTSVFSSAVAFDLPDVEVTALDWPQREPEAPFPWLWLEQSTAERGRRSNSGVFAALQGAGVVRIVVAGPQASGPARLAAALRETPVARALAAEVDLRPAR
jgi:hypothetical protein